MAQSTGRMKVITLEFLFWKAKPHGCCVSVSREGARDPSFHAQDLLMFAVLQCVPFSGFNIYTLHTYYIYKGPFGIKDSKSAAWIVWKIIRPVIEQPHARHLTPEGKSWAAAFLSMAKSEVRGQYAPEQTCLVARIETTC